MIVDLFLIVMTYGFIQSCANYLLKQPLEELNKKGDPMPLLKETQELLKCKINEANMQYISMMYCAALRESGEIEKASAILNSINIDKFYGVLPVVKVLYYNNLADVCELLGDEEKSSVWITKMFQIYHDMPENKAKKQISNAVTFAKANEYFKKGDHKQAAVLLDRIITCDLPLKLETLLLRAKIALSLNDTETARDNLDYIIANGNKLYSVTAAREVLQKIMV